MTDPRIIRFIMILGVINGALLTIGIWTGAFSFFLFFLSIPLSALCVLVIEKIGSSFGRILSGQTPGKTDYREQLIGELEKIKYSKRMGHFDDALRLVNELLHREPDFPDALYLKAHILWEGFENAEAAKTYLKKVKDLVPKDDPLHQWASSYYDEVINGMKES